MLYSAVFGLYSLMEVLGLMPQEVRSAGITLPAIFSALYGDQVGTSVCLLVRMRILASRVCVQNVDFVGYHVRRTTATVLLHSHLPLVFSVGLGLVEPQWHMVREREREREIDFTFLCVGSSIRGLFPPHS